MNDMNFILDFVNPSSILAAYIAIAITNKFSKLENKNKFLIAISIGVLVSLIEEVQLLNIHKVISGALSGLIAYEANAKINSYIKKIGGK